MLRGRGSYDIAAVLEIALASAWWRVKSFVVFLHAGELMYICIYVCMHFTYDVLVVEA